MLKRGKSNTKGKAAGGNKSATRSKHDLTLKWTYNYFSVGSNDSINNWRENLPLSLREALANE
jgi:hypothetical protein